LALQRERILPAEHEPGLVLAEESRNHAGLTHEHTIAAKTLQLWREVRRREVRERLEEEVDIVNQLAGRTGFQERVDAVAVDTKAAARVRERVRIEVVGSDQVPASAWA